MRGTIVWLGAVALGAGCGSSNAQSATGGPPDASVEAGVHDAAAADSPSDGPTDAGPVEAAVPLDGGAGCNAYVDAYCAQLMSCAPSEFNQAFGDAATCVGRLTPVCTTELTAPGTAATQASMQACGQAIAQQSCTNFRTVEPPECLLTGTLAGGAGCEFSSQCGSAFCDSGAGWCGHCEPRVGTGGACTPTLDLRFSPCQPGLTCSLGQCVTPVPSGGACQNDVGQCLFPLGCTGGTCMQPTPLGGSGCNAGSCVRGAYCADAGTCQAIAYDPIGMPCDLASGGKPCFAGGHCQAGPNGSVCVADTADGQPCTTSLQCAAPSLCTNGICQVAVDPSTCH
ncbi:MAG TPA: hypothetical protein VHV30_06815 [Polyangiaceae bacterium]|nr:hypothetical protein [Polyangiaceae bacterium]